MNIYDFLTLRYAKSYLSCNTKDAIHCYHYDLDAKEKVYNSNICPEYYNTFNFFSSVIKILLNNIKDITPEDNNLVTNELDSMVESLPAFQKAVTNYASHRLRENIQFDAIKKITTDLKDDTFTVLIIIDHKQKIEPMK